MTFFFWVSILSFTCSSVGNKLRTKLLYHGVGQLGKYSEKPLLYLLRLFYAALRGMRDRHLCVLPFALVIWDLESRLGFEDLSSLEKLMMIGQVYAVFPLNCLCDCHGLKCNCREVRANSCTGLVLHFIMQNIIVLVLIHSLYLE